MYSSSRALQSFPLSHSPALLVFQGGEEETVVPRITGNGCSLLSVGVGCFSGFPDG
jgi:hypothetical protein